MSNSKVLLSRQTKLVKRLDFTQYHYNMNHQSKVHNQTNLFWHERINKSSLNACIKYKSTCMKNRNSVDSQKNSLLNQQQRQNGVNKVAKNKKIDRVKIIRKETQQSGGQLNFTDKRIIQLDNKNEQVAPSFPTIIKFSHSITSKNKNNRILSKSLRLPRKDLSLTPNGRQIVKLFKQDSKIKKQHLKTLENYPLKTQKNEQRTFPQQKTQQNYQKSLFNIDIQRMGVYSPTSKDNINKVINHLKFDQLRVFQTVQSRKKNIQIKKNHKKSILNQMSTIEGDEFRNAKSNIRTKINFKGPTIVHINPVLKERRPRQTLYDQKRIILMDENNSNSKITQKYKKNKQIIRQQEKVGNQNLEAWNNNQEQSNYYNTFDHTQY